MTIVPVLLLLAGAIGVWMLVRRLGLRRSGSSDPGPAGLDEINQWYGAAQERMSLMERDDVISRGARWEAAHEAQRLEESDRFIEERFGAGALKALNAMERMRIGKIHSITG